MNFRLPAILFVAILAVAVVALIVLWSSDSESTDVLLEELNKVKAEQIDKVEMEREGGGTLKFTRADKEHWNEEWEVTAPGGEKQVYKAKADPISVNEMINALLRAKPTTSTSLTTNPAVHGLQPPTLRITLHQGSEHSSTLNVGDVTSGGKAVAFVTTSARPKRPLATSRSNLEVLFRSSSPGKAGDLAKWASDYRVKSVFDTDVRGSGEDVQQFTLSSKGKTLSLERAPGGWKFVTPAGWESADALGDSTPAGGAFTGVRPLLTALTNLQALKADDFIESPSAEELTKDGLNDGNPDSIKVEIKSKEKGTSVAILGKPDGALSTGKIWVKVEGQPGIIHANGGDLSGLAAVIANPDPLRDRTLLATDRSRIDGIDIVVGTQTTKLRKAGAIPEWKLYGNPAAGDPQSTSSSAVNKLLDLLLDRRSIKGFPAANPANFVPAETRAEVKIWADGFETPTDPKAEPKEKSKPTILVFGHKEGDSIYVRRILPDGATTDFLLPDRLKIGPGEPSEVIPAVAKSRLDFLDTSLKTFGLDAVTKVTVSGVRAFELDRDDRKTPGKERWVYSGPADLKGKTADAATVAEMLRLLGTTVSVSRYVDEAPTPQKLIEYGLAPAPMSPSPAPRLKIVVSLKTEEADKERVYEFGVPTGDLVYARQAGKMAVFALPKLLYDKFADADLRDRAIFDFDPAQITAIEFKGWKPVIGNAVTYAFERDKDQGWKTTDPKGFNVDPRKVDAFLSGLTATTVKSFLAGGLKTEYGFNIDQQEGLQIVLKTATGTLMLLNVGAPTDGGAAYYVWSSALPPNASVFTLDSSRFKSFKEKPAFFSK